MSTMMDKASLGFFFGFHAFEVAALVLGVVGLLTVLLW